MNSRWFAKTDYDESIERTAPDITDVIEKARDRYLAAPEDERDIDTILDTELDAIARMLRAALNDAETPEAPEPPTTVPLVAPGFDLAGLIADANYVAGREAAKAEQE